jgi:hypothetical protein
LKLYNNLVEIKIHLCTTHKALLMETDRYTGTEKIREKVVITNQELFLHESIVRVLVHNQSLSPVFLAQWNNLNSKHS